MFCPPLSEARYDTRNVLLRWPLTYSRPDDYYLALSMCRRSSASTARRQRRRWPLNSFPNSGGEVPRTQGGRRSIRGFSGGAWWAAFVALQHPESFGNVLSQAGAFQLNWTARDPNVLARLFADAPRRAIRFHLSVGLYENVRGGDLSIHEMALSLSLLPSNRRLRDVLRAKGYEVIYLETASSHDSMQTTVTLAQGPMALLPLRHDGQPPVR